ncbi:MAG: GDSL-like Lipase/Acylhydrolase family [Solirubrobacteraceae bacterium]|nr:GDSL-like Lipase/Acylhydrolase family [Solirubrobacteraceae bacterium]
MRLSAVAVTLLVLLAALAGCREKPEPEIAADPCPGPSLVAFGHSFVQGNAPGAPEKPWPARVADELGVCEDNRGLAGSQSVHTAGFVEGYTPKDGDVVVIETILNDIFVTGVRGLPAFRKNVDRMLDHLRKADEQPKRVVLVIDPPPAKWTDRPNQEPPFVHGSNGTLDQYAEALADIARKNRATVVDLRRGWEAERLELPDELHPDEQGTARIARIVTRALR